MERSIKHSNDGGKTGVSRCAFLGGVSAAKLGSALCENTPIMQNAAAAEPSNATVIGPPPISERHAKPGKYCLQARRRDHRTSCPGSTCARLLSRPEADAGHASPAPTSNPGDVRITDPNSRVVDWEGNDD